MLTFTARSIRRLSLAVIAAALFAASAASCVTYAPPPPPPPAPPPPAYVEPPPFHGDLAPHGDWWWNDDFGWVWSPYVDTAWRPYTVGHWAWTSEYGWLWVSDEPFGWACFHYGRWAWLDDAGWIWIPGRVWAPAWVSWRHGGGYVGWSPLGPESIWVPGRGVVVVVVHGHTHVHDDPWGWTFVEERHVTGNVVEVIVPYARNVTVFAQAAVVHTDIVADSDGRVMNRGVDRAIIERARGKELTPVPVTVIDDHDEDRTGAARVDPARAEGVVRVRRARDVETKLDARGDTFTRRAQPALLDDGAELRPLSTPEPDDVDRRHDEEAARSAERHRQERALPAPPPPDIERRQAREIEEIERARQKEKVARDKKKSVPRKVYPKKKKVPTPAGPLSDREDDKKR